MVRTSLNFWRSLLEDVCGSPLYDEDTHIPSLFDVERIDLEYGCEMDVHWMVMDAKRSILDCWGWISWWIESIPGWMVGIPNEVVQKVLNLELPSYEKRGFLLSVNRDWTNVNFPQLVQQGVPFYYVWGLFEGRDKRFARLDPELIKRWLHGGDRNELEDLWADDIPFVSSIYEIAARYDRFLQLKIDPYCRPRNPLPKTTEISGAIEYWVMDFQHWTRRRLSDEETPEGLHELYHHIVLESRSQQVTRVVFHRFLPKPRREALTDQGEIMDDEPLIPDLSTIRERFKGRGAPEYGQIFDPETGVERQKVITKDDPIDVVARYEHELLLVAPPGPLGGRLLSRQVGCEDASYDATKFGRHVGPRVSSPYSDHSSERREYDSSEPMAHTVGWVMAMAGEDWSDSTDRYVENRNGRRPTISIRERRAESADDAQSYYSLEEDGQSSPGPRLHSPRRSASPERRGRRSYPIRAATPPVFHRHPSRGETLAELEDRRAGWLNTFVDWGRAATYEASLWRKPVDFSWNQDVLEYGYLIIDEASEFRLRFQAIANPAIRFPRHLLEVGMERGIQFTIGYKKADHDRWRPSRDEEDISRTVTKAMVDLRAKGPRLEFSPLISTIYREFRGNLGKIGDSPNMRCLILHGGPTSWILRAFVGMGLVRRAMSGPSVQVTVHHCSANDSGDDNSLDLAWDDVSDGDYEAVHGYIRGPTSELDTYLFPTAEMLEEYSDHYYREWNPFCEKTFHHIKMELDGGRGKARTKAEWRKYFQSSNRGTFKPNFVANREFIEEGVARMKGALQYSGWNKKRIRDIARDLPPVFQNDF
jgi:hypothetical protein